MGAEAPTLYEEMSRSEVEVEEFPNLTGVYQGSVRYSKSSGNNLASEPTFRFETRGGSQKVTQSLATTRYGDGAANAGGAIGATADAVEGTDITVPIYTFSESHTFSDSDVTTAYKSILFSATGTVNAATFKGLAAGEALFLGAAGNRQGDGNWTIDLLSPARLTSAGCRWEISAGSQKKAGNTSGSATRQPKIQPPNCWSRNLWGFTSNRCTDPQTSRP